MNTTIGIEIELPWPTMLARVDVEAAQILADSNGFYGLPHAEQTRVQRGFDALDAEYKETVESVFDERIVRGNDGFAEFALRPQHETEDLVETTAQLYDKGILTEDEVYPLHVTVGNVAPNGASWLVLMAMELSGGTTSDRMVQTTTWSRKGSAGILPRKPEELQLGSRVGYEMRTLLLQDIHSLDRILRIAQIASTSMAYAANNQRGAPAAIAVDLRRVLTDAAAEKSLNIGKRWKNPQNDIRPWQKLSAALIDKEWVAGVSADINEIVSG